MPSLPVNQAPGVAAARASIDGFYLRIDDLWCRVESQPWLLEVGICLLLDQDDTNGHFAGKYKAYWPGKAEDNNGPSYLDGAVLDPVVAALFEEYLAILPIGNREVNLAIPTSDQAQAMLPQMRERRRSA